MIHFLGVVDTPKNIFVLMFFGFTLGFLVGVIFATRRVR